MNEQTLVKISLGLIVIGLSLLFFYAEEIELKPRESINQLPRQETVKIKGIVEKIHRADKAIFLTISGQQQVHTDVIVFPKEDIFLEEGSNVEITGMVEEYKGKKEIIGSEVVVK